MIKVSIVIPVYNSQEHLSACVESLLNQTLQEYELIFVNDGSTDTSGEILKQFGDKEKRIQIIEQENKGVSIARNQGIKKAKGEYIGFVDSDDFVKSTMFETLYQIAEEQSSDLVISNMLLGRDNKYIEKKHSFSGLYEKKDIHQKLLPNLLETEELFSTCTNLYRRDLLINNNILFPVKIHYEEDALFNMSVFLQGERVFFINFAGYYCRDNKTSASRRVTYEEMFSIALKKYNFNYRAFCKLDMTETHLTRLKSFRFFDKVCYIVFLMSTHKRNTLKMTYGFAKEILMDSKTQKAIKHLNPERGNFGRFHKVIHNIATNKSFWKLYFLITVLKIFYTPQISELFRKIN